MTGTPIDAVAIEAILFDLDGTLVETDNRWARAMGRRLAFLRRVNRRLDTERLGRDIVMAIETPSNYAVSFAERIGLGKSIYGLADRIRRSKGIATEGASVLVAGADGLIADLAKHFVLALVTTRARREALSFLAQQGLERYFPVIVTRQDVLRMKPHPEPVRRAAQMLGVPPERCMMVGDTTMDVLAARRAGTFAVGVLSGFGQRAELERAGAHLILDSAVDLAAYLLVSPDGRAPKGAPA